MCKLHIILLVHLLNNNYYLFIGRQSTLGRCATFKSIFCLFIYILYLLPFNILRLQNPCVIIKRFISTFLDLVELIILHFLEQAMEILLTGAQLTPLSNQIIIIKLTPLSPVLLTDLHTFSLRLSQENLIKYQCIFPLVIISVILIRSILHCYEEFIKQISSRRTSPSIFLVIFAGIALKLDKVVTTFLSYNTPNLAYFMPKLFR